MCYLMPPANEPFNRQKRVRQLLHKHVIIHCNEDEIGYFGKSGESMDEIAKSIFEETQSPVLVTLGAKGTFITMVNVLTSFPVITSRL